MTKIPQGLAYPHKKFFNSTLVLLREAVSESPYPPFSVSSRRPFRPNCFFSSLFFFRSTTA